MRDFFPEQWKELNRALAHAVMQHDDIAGDYFNRFKAGIIGNHCTNIAEWAACSVTGVHRDCQ